MWNFSSSRLFNCVSLLVSDGSSPWRKSTGVFLCIALDITTNREQLGSRPRKFSTSARHAAELFETTVKTAAGGAAAVQVARPRPDAGAAAISSSTVPAATTVQGKETPSVELTPRAGMVARRTPQPTCRQVLWNPLGSYCLQREEGYRTGAATL